MSLLEMSFLGGTMILAAVVLRALLLNRLPKTVFVTLWGIILLRLLIPVAVPSAFGFSALLAQAPALAGNQETGNAAARQTGARSSATSGTRSSMPAEDQLGAEGVKNGALLREEEGMRNSTLLTEADKEDTALSGADLSTAPGKGQSGGEWRNASALGSILEWCRGPWAFGIWILGAAVCALFFVAVYLRCRKEFCASLPVENPIGQEWIQKQSLRRRVSLRCSDRIGAPLTYGIRKPVILVPDKMEFGRDAKTAFILTHELVHIRRLDAVKKFLLTAVLCIHWFNPLVWVMYILANRDLELSCDEKTVRLIGLKAKAAYAYALISMEEKKSGLAPLASHFSKNAIEERIIAIMKMKKISAAARVLGAVMIFGVTTVFATSAAEPAETASTEEAGPAEETASTEEAGPAEETASTEEAGPAEETASTEEAGPAEETASTEEAGPAASTMETEEAVSAEAAASTEEAGPAAATVEAEEAVPAAAALSTHTSSEVPGEEIQYLKEYEKFGVTEKDGILYYKEEPIRFFLDGYEGESTLLARYLYVNEAGTVDVHTVRAGDAYPAQFQEGDASFTEDAKNSQAPTAPEAEASGEAAGSSGESGTELFGEITDIVAYSQEEFDARDPSKAIELTNDMANSSTAEEGDEAALAENESQSALLEAAAGERSAASAEEDAAAAESGELMLSVEAGENVSVEGDVSAPGSAQENGTIALVVSDAEENGQ